MSIAMRGTLVVGGLCCCLAAGAQANEGKLYTPGPFEKIAIGGAADVKLVQGNEDQVFIAGDADVQKGVRVSLEDNILTVQSREGWKFWTSSRLQISVTARKLSGISLAGAANLQAPGPLAAERLVVKLAGTGQARLDDVTADSLQFSMAGAGEAQASGRVRELSLHVAGKGRLQAENLQCQQANVSISGLGNATLWVQEELRIKIAGAGFIDYWGRPTVRPSVAGTSSIKGLGDKR